MPDPIVVVDYDPQWPARFERLRARLAVALADVAVTIEHAGSTSVPGLAAKPTIDILVLLSSADQLPLAIRRLAAIGYAHEGDRGIEGREAFANPPGAGAHDHHLYVCPPGSAQFHDQIAFRDYLRANGDIARAYGELKRDLAARFGQDRVGYTNAKADFVREVLRRANRTACNS